MSNVPVRDLIDATCRYYNIRDTSLLGPSRKRHFTHPRQVLYAVLRRKTNLSLPQIGRVIGGRDHSTVKKGIMALESRDEMNERHAIQAIYESAYRRASQRSANSRAVFIPQASHRVTIAYHVGLPS